MSQSPVEAAIAELNEPQRTTLATVRDRILTALPRDADVDECISYGIPTIKVAGKAVAGFAANRSSCSYYPFSGSVLAALAEDLATYSQSKSALHFPHDRPLPVGLVRKLVRVRLAEIAARGR